MGSDILEPVPRAEGRTHYVDDQEFVRLVLSRRRFERVGPRGEVERWIRDVETSEVYELDPGSRRSGPTQSVPPLR